MNDRLLTVALWLAVVCAFFSGLLAFLLWPQKVVLEESKSYYHIIDYVAPWEEMAHYD